MADEPVLTQTPFGAIKTAAQNVQFAIDPSHGLTRSRYGWYSNGTRFDSTNFTENPGSIGLSTTATGSDRSRIHSAFPGQYVSQALAQPGQGLIIDSSDVNITDGKASLTHGRIATGAFTYDTGNTQIDTGLGTQITGSGAEVFLKSGGSHQSDSPVAQADWNIDPLDGTGPSGRVLDPSDGYIFNQPYTWYNQGALYIGLIDPVNEVPILVHKFIVRDGPSMETPNLPTHVLVENNGTADTLSAELGGMQYSTYGAQGAPEKRVTSEARVSISVGTQYSTTENAIDPAAEPGVPLVSFRRESGNPQVTVSSQEFTANGDANVYVYVWDEWEPGTALTGASFTDPVSRTTDSESDIVTDTQATDYAPSTANLRNIIFVSGGKDNKSVPVTTAQTENRLPLNATRVYTSVHAGTAATIDPFNIDIIEGF